MIFLVASWACGGSKPAVRVQSARAPEVRDSGAVLPPVVAVASPKLRTDTRPLPHDVAQLRGVHSARISPDGKRVVFAVRIPKLDPEAKPPTKDGPGGTAWKVEQQLFLVDRAGGTPRQLTFGKKQAHTPRWSPDGKTLAFLREKGKRTVLYLLPMEGGEPRPLDLGELEPAEYEWSPDGASLGFLATPPRSVEEKTEKWASGGVVHYDAEWRSAQLYVVDRAPQSEPRQVTKGTDNIISFRWSPDGKRFALVTSKSADPYLVWSLRFVSIVSAEDGSLLHQLETEPALVEEIEWSPDGRYLAYQRAENSLSMLNVLRVRDVHGEGSWNAAAQLDPTLEGFVWSPDSRSLIAHVAERTRSNLYRLSYDGRTAKSLGPLDRVLSGGLQADRSGRFLATVSSSPTSPWAPTVVDAKTGALRPVADLNPQVSDWKLAKVEVVKWKNAEGVEIEGLLYVTPHAQPGTPPPLMVMPHGGPDAVTSQYFSGWTHYFAARGYSVFRPNYRGGFGYGRDFYAANRGRLGEIEFADIESGVDSLIAAGKADPARLFYGGWSWGGYITAWTIGGTKRYRAAVVGAGVIDVVLGYATSDINHGVVGDWEFKGRPWQNPEAFARANPSPRLKNAVTPTLILHGRNDRRVDFVQSEVLYRALSDVGCKTEFLAYPGEPHSFGQPAHNVSVLEAWARWYDAHLP